MPSHLTLGPRQSAPLFILIALILVILLPDNLAFLSLFTYTLYAPWHVAQKPWWAESREDGCAAWNPLYPKQDDPEACTRARQYRQVQRVLEGQERAEQ